MVAIDMSFYLSSIFLSYYYSCFFFLASALPINYYIIHLYNFLIIYKQNNQLLIIVLRII